MIRTFIIVIAVIIYAVFSILFYLVQKLIGLFNKELEDRITLAVMRCGFKGLLFLAGAKTEYKGEENIPEDKPVLYVGNHRSGFDIVLTYSRIKRPTGFVSKKEWKKIPVLNMWMDLLHCLFMDRNDIKSGLKTILDAIEMIKSGVSVFIFPEGTRNHGEGLLPFKEGSFKIAKKTDCPVIPVAISGSDDLMEKHMPWIRGANVTVEYGKPVIYSELSGEDQKFMAKYVQEQILEMLEKNGSGQDAG